MKKIKLLGLLVLVSIITFCTKEQLEEGEGVNVEPPQQSTPPPHHI